MTGCGGSSAPDQAGGRGVFNLFLQETGRLHEPAALDAAAGKHTELCGRWTAPLGHSSEDRRGDLLHPPLVRSKWVCPRVGQGRSLATPPGASTSHHLSPTAEVHAAGAAAWATSPHPSHHTHKQAASTRHHLPRQVFEQQHQDLATHPPGAWPPAPSSSSPQVPALRWQGVQGACDDEMAPWRVAGHPWPHEAGLRATGPMGAAGGSPTHLPWPGTARGLSRCAGLGCGRGGAGAWAVELGRWTWGDAALHAAPLGLALALLASYTWPCNVAARGCLCGS